MLRYIFGEKPMARSSRMKIIFISCSLFLVCSTVKSQLQFGAKAGINLATQTRKISTSQVSANMDTRMLLGYHFGLYSKTKIGKDLLLAAETNFSLVGAGYNLIGSDAILYKVKEKIGYIDVPITVQCKVEDFYFGAGPGFGFKLFSKVTGFENRSYDITYYRGVDVSANFVAGYNFSKRLGAGIRYAHSLTPLHKSQGGSIKYKNRVTGISLTYSLRR